MFFKIIGIFWIIVGLYFVFRPGAFVNRLKRKGVRTVRRTLFPLALFLGITFVSFGLKQPGALPKIILFLGIAGMIKAIVLFNSKLTVKTAEVIAKAPPSFYRAGGLMYILMGMFLFLLKS